MEHTASRQRLYAALLGAGACILLFRTTLMIAQGYLGILLPWVAGLLLVELALDLGCLLGSIRWWVAGDEARARLPLRLGAAATIPAASLGSTRSDTGASQQYRCQRAKGPPYGPIGYSLRVVGECRATDPWE